MAAKDRQGRGSNRRWWAGAILAIAAAGAFASTSAAQQANLASASACTASQIGVGYELGIDATLGGYAVTGIRVTEFPAQCAGQSVAVTVHAASGAALGTATGRLGTDTVLSMPASTPVPASQADRLTIAPAA